MGFGRTGERRAKVPVVQRDRDLALAEFAFGLGRFVAHAATIAGKLTSRPEGAGSPPPPAPAGHNAAVTALISV
jgi:hypothetical protein